MHENQSKSLWLTNLSFKYKVHTVELDTMLNAGSLMID